MLVLNTKQELLDWAIENIEKWEEEYTHLFCDDSPAPLFYSKRFELWYIDGDWTFDDSEFATDFKGLEAGVKASTPLVVSKQEYMEAKNMKENTFKLEDLKTGMRVTTRNGSVSCVFKDATTIERPGVSCYFVNLNGQNSWDHTGSYNKDFTQKDGYTNLDIVKVEVVNHPCDTLDPKASCTTSWERVEETEAQKKLRELKVKQENLVKTQQELVKSQQEVAKMISELEGNVK